MLTIVDSCNSPRITSVSSGVYSFHDPKRFKKKQGFCQGHVHLPIACEMNDATWAFRVGEPSQPRDDTDRNSFERMTPPFGDSIASSILLAIKKFGEDPSSDLDAAFRANYLNISRSFLPSEAAGKPYSDLSSLRKLIESGVLRIDLRKFNCLLFQRRDRWFLTFERAVHLMQEDRHR